jgi:hypothetical protein
MIKTVHLLHKYLQHIVHKWLEQQELPRAQVICGHLSFIACRFFDCVEKIDSPSRGERVEPTGLPNAPLHVPQISFIELISSIAMTASRKWPSWHQDD